MCFVWYGKIERCENCSEVDFQNFLGVVLNIDFVRPTHQLAARTAQYPPYQGPPLFSRYDVHADLQRCSTNENLGDRKQDLTHRARPSSSAEDSHIDGMAQHKRQKTNENQPPRSIHDAPINGTAQHKRPRKNADRPSSSRQDTRIHGSAHSGQQTQSQDQPSSSRGDTRSDLANGRGQKESHKEPRSSSMDHAITDVTGEEDHSRSHLRIEDMEVLTAGMNKPPTPCWEDERVFFPLVRQQLMNEEYFGRQEQQGHDIWAPYGNEREALAASHTLEPEEDWIPMTQEEEILERAVPLQEEMWERSVLDGEAWMRNALDEEKAWPQEPPEGADIWTREDGGMLTSAMLKQLLRVLTLQASLGEERFQSANETDGLAPRPMMDWDEVTHDFSDVSSAAYPPLASQAQH